MQAAAAHGRRVPGFTTAPLPLLARRCAVQGVYGFCSDEPMVVEEIADGLFEVKDPDVDLEDVAAAALPRVPPQPSLSVHWLAVEGVQPRVPQNPPRQPSWDLFATGGTGAGGGSGTAASNTGHQLLRGGATKRARDSISADSAAIVYPGIVVQHHGQRVRVKVKPQVTHQLSAEMQVYFGKVVEAIRLHDASAEAVIGTLRTHAGLHQLVPYFCHFIPREVGAHARRALELCSLVVVVATADGISLHVISTSLWCRAHRSTVTCATCRC